MVSSRKINRKPPGPGDPRHGQYRGYIAGCREPCCIAAERAYQNESARMRAYGRPRKVSALGSQRRLQALMAIGWSGEYLAERLGMRRSNLPVTPKGETIRVGTADRIKELYAELLVKDGPSTKTRKRAAAKGWAAPDQWLGRYIDDPKAVPAPAGEAPQVDVDKVALVARAERLNVPHSKTMKYLKVDSQQFAELLREARKTP